MSTDSNNATPPAIPQAPGDAPNLRVHVGGDIGPGIGTGDGNVISSSGVDTMLTLSSVEFLDVADSQAVSHSADVHPYPTGEEFAREIDGHQKAIADLQAKLGEVHYDARTGQVKGHRYEGEARRHLELQLGNRQTALHYTTFNLSRAHQAAAERTVRAAQRAADGQPSTDTTSVQEAVRREQLIAATANDIGADGKPLGRVKATQLVDDELARSRVAARVKASR